MIQKKLTISNGYEVQKYFIPASLTAPQTARKTGARARKSLMNTPLTYQYLLDQQARRVQFEGYNQQTAANRATALRGFLAANHINIADVVGDEMRIRHPEAIERFVSLMAGQGRSLRHINNTRSALRSWREAVVEHDTVVALTLGKATPFAQAVTNVLHNQSIRYVAKQAGIPKDMLMGWMRGKIPRASSERFVLRLENFFGLERNSLVLISGMQPSGRRAPVGPPATPSAYNEKVSSLTKTPYCLKPTIESPLRQQWAEFLRYKTAAVPMLRRTKRGKWRVSPCPLTATTATNWWAFHEGKEVASARMAWQRISAYLGWLQLPPEAGGVGIPENKVHTLAWLAVPQYLEGFLDWNKSRIGKRNQGVTQFLALIASLVRERFGYLAQRHELQTTLPSEFQAQSWDDLCRQQFELTEQLVAAYHGEIEVSRNSFEPIRNIVELPQPMDAIVDMIHRMRADRPVGQPRMEPIWARDIALIKLLTCIPLRRRNLAHLTWREDNTGDLYQRTDKSWWIRLSKAKFKNAQGAAGDNVFDCQLHPSAWPDVERYLFIYRAQLLREPTDLVFLSRESHGIKNHRPWIELSARVHTLTARYIASCPGIGAHAFRHIVATSILKADGGDYKTAALMLNDRLTTVEKHYSGLRSNDGAQRMGELLKGQFSRM